jgi:hypothetical protein
MTMYATCLNCDRSLGSNADLEHLPVGRRVAFDEETGRVWVICLRCRQWNLVPIEIRWEALEECTRVAASAESRVKGTGVGFARTASGFELLTATEFSRADIANWRYGRAVRRRMRGLWLTAGAMGLAVTAIGVNAGVAGGSWFVGAWITACAALWTWHAWRNPSRLWVTVRVAGAGPSLLPGWRLEALRFVRRLPRSRSLSRVAPSGICPSRSSSPSYEGQSKSAIVARSTVASCDSTVRAANVARRSLSEFSRSEALNTSTFTANLSAIVTSGWLP